MRRDPSQMEVKSVDDGDQPMISNALTGQKEVLQSIETAIHVCSTQ